jgi:hypothetical protein
MKRKAQHEIAGFVLIVLVVSVVGVVFFTLSFGKGDVSRQTSLEVSHLLGAAMYQTSECAVGYIPNYRDLQTLIKDCRKEKLGNPIICLDEKNVCEVLEKELKESIGKGFSVHEDSPNKAFKLEIYYSGGEDIPNEQILNFSEGNFGNCTSIVGGDHPIPASSFESGNIETELVLCKG